MKVAVLVALVAVACGDRPAPPPAPASTTVAPPPPRHPKRAFTAATGPRRLPLTLGEDLSALARAIEGTDRAGSVPVAPCMVEVHDEKERSTVMRSILVRGDRVYEVDGGYRREDGSIVICWDGAPAVYEIDARGRGTRWKIDFGGVADPEPADCRVTEGSVSCGDFAGTIADDFIAHRDVRRVGETRLVRFDRPATDPCDAIVERAWIELAATRAFLELPADETAHRQYVREQYRFRGECEHATAEARACVSGQRSVIRRTDACALSAPDFVWGAHEVDPDRRSLSSAEAAALRRALVGTWTQDRGRYGERRWTFGADGQLREPGREVQSYVLPRAGELVLDTENSRARLPFARDGADRFYADYAVECPRQPRRATVALGGQDELVIRGGTCKTITPYGELRDARCELFEGDLEVTYVSWLGKAQKKVVRIVDGCFVRDEIEPFVRYR